MADIQFMWHILRFKNVFLFISVLSPIMDAIALASEIKELCPKHDVDTISTTSTYKTRYRIDIDS
jgi:hypothetical protein